MYYIRAVKIRTIGNRMDPQKSNFSKIAMTRTDEQCTCRTAMDRSPVGIHLPTSQDRSLWPSSKDLLRSERRKRNNLNWKKNTRENMKNDNFWKKRTFLKTDHWLDKRSFPPFSPQRFGRSGWKSLRVVGPNRGACFFLFAKILPRKNLAALTRSRYVQQKWFFVDLFSIFDLLPRKFNIFQRKKKHAPRFRPTTHKKNFSPIGRTVPEKKGENF